MNQPIDNGFGTPKETYTCRWCGSVYPVEEDCTSCDGPDEYVAPDGGRAS